MVQNLPRYEYLNFYELNLNYLSFITKNYHSSRFLLEKFKLLYIYNLNEIKFTYYIQINKSRDHNHLKYYLIINSTFYCLSKVFSKFLYLI